MKSWCKIIEFDNHDVLIQRRFDTDDDKEKVMFTIKTGEVALDLSIGFDTKEESDKIFNEISNDKVKEFINNNLHGLVEI